VVRRVPWFAITVAKLLAASVACVACAAYAACSAAIVTEAKPAGPVHDPDHVRGELPSRETRRNELAELRRALDAMYAHRAAKLARYRLDEQAIFRDAETSLLAATSWLAYDRALYAALAAFHDGHLTYRPPSTAAPSRGYTSFRLGLGTTVAHGHLLIVETDPGSDVANAGTKPGDEVTAIDGKPVTDVLAAQVALRSDARPESAHVAFAKTWTSALYPKGTAPRVRTIDIAPHDGSAALHVTIKPRLAASAKHDAIAIAHVGDIAIVTLRSLEGGTVRAAAIDTVLAEARGSHAIVIDLRGNRGGIGKVGYRVVADLAEGTASLGTYRVLAAPETLARRPMWKDLAAESDGFSSVQHLTVDALPHKYVGKLAVVTDAGCISTCEQVTAALRADIGAIVVGETTGGSSGAPVSVTLPASRGTVQIPTWNLLAADGRPIEDDGVVPDVDVAATADALAQQIDRPLQTAIDRIR